MTFAKIFSEFGRIREILDGALNFAGLDAGRANFHAFDRVFNERTHWLQVWQPAAFAMRVVVGTQKGVPESRGGTLSANIATFSHNSFQTN